MFRNSADGTATTWSNLAAGRRQPAREARGELSPRLEQRYSSARMGRDLKDGMFAEGEKLVERNHLISSSTLTLMLFNAACRLACRGCSLSGEGECRVGDSSDSSDN